MCYHMFRTHKSICHAKCHAKEFGCKRTTETSPWFGGEFLKGGEYMDHIRSFVRSSLLAEKAGDPEIKCLGFKEIRYTEEDINNDFEEYLDFLKIFFPNVAFVFNTRNIKDTRTSDWWRKKDPNYVVKLLGRADRQFDKYAKKHPECTFSLKYEDVVSKNKKLEQLFDFLGAPYDSDTIDKVINKEHSYGKKG